MSTDIIKNADVFQAFYFENFSGRKEIVKKIEKNIELVKKSGGRSIINLFGIGGIGKTSILEYMKCKLKNNGTLSASVDFKYNSLDVFDIISSLHTSLVDASDYSSVAFEQYDTVQKEMQKIEEKLLKQLKKKDGITLSNLFSEPISEVTMAAGKSAGQVIGDSIVPVATNAALSGILVAAGGVVGTGIGALAGAGLGLAISKITLLEYKQNIVKAFIEGVNKLVEKGESLVLGFDTFENAPTTISQWLRWEIIPNLNNKIIVFICGRERIANEMLWNDISNIINAIPIKLFSSKEAEEYLKKRKIADEERIKWIINFTGCLPWALALVVDFIGDSWNLDEANSTENFDEDRIGEQVVGRFLDHINDENLKDAIYVCASANYFTFDILSSSYFAHLGEENKIKNENIIKIFKKIRDYSFTIKLDNEKYAIHDVVSKFLINGQKRFNMSKYKEQSNFFATITKKSLIYLMM